MKHISPFLKFSIFCRTCRRHGYVRVAYATSSKYRKIQNDSRVKSRIIRSVGSGRES